MTTSFIVAQLFKRAGGFCERASSMAPTLLTAIQIHPIASSVTDPERVCHCVEGAFALLAIVFEELAIETEPGPPDPASRVAKRLGVLDRYNAIRRVPSLRVVP